MFDHSLPSLILYDATTEKAHDVPACGWKTDTPPTSKCHSICPPDCYLQTCLAACAFCILWACLQMMSPQTEPQPDHRISSTSSHPLKCSCKGLALPHTPRVLTGIIFVIIGGLRNHQHFSLNPAGVQESPAQAWTAVQVAWKDSRSSVTDQKN